MSYGKMLLCASVLLMLTSCDFMRERVLVPTYPSLGANLAADCDGPVTLKPGDNIPAAALENAHRLKDCADRHKSAVQVCQPRSGQ